MRDMSREIAAATEWMAEHVNSVNRETSAGFGQDRLGRSIESAVNNLVDQSTQDLRADWGRDLAEKLRGDPDGVLNVNFGCTVDNVATNARLHIEPGLVQVRTELGPELRTIYQGDVASELGETPPK